MTENDDSTLIEEYLEGNEKSLEKLIERYLNSVYNFTLRYLRDEAEASDVTQETFLKVWKNLRKFDLTKNFKTWLFTIARNSSLDRLRKKKALPFSSLENDEDEGSILATFKDEENLPDVLFDQNLEREKLENAISGLPEIYKSVILLRLEENFTFIEIADILNEPLDTIKSRYRRGLSRLRQSIEKKL